MKEPSIILTGGSGPKDKSSIEIIYSDSKSKLTLPNLPHQGKNSSIFTHNGTLMVCGGSNENAKKCYQLVNGFWTKFTSDLKIKRCGASVVTTSEATFIFGGIFDPTSFEYLPKNGKNWKLGENEIPKDFYHGSAVEVKSKQEIWLIGGKGGCCRILVFNIKTHIFKELGSILKWCRIHHACISTILDGNEVILVTGGTGTGILSGKSPKSVEIINTQDGKVTMLSNRMVLPRIGHGIGILKIENQEKIVIFGGTDGENNHYDSVEIFDEKTKDWKLAENMKMSEARYFFSFTNF